MDALLRKAKLAAILGTALAALSGTVAAAGAAVQPASSAQWSQTNYNAAQSRANLAEQTLTRATVGKIRYLRGMAFPPDNPNGGCLFDSPGASAVAPVLTGGSAYAVTNGYLTKYDPATGAIVWRQNPDPGFSTLYESLAVAGGLVVVGGLNCGSVSGPQGFLWAFNTSTGARVWLRRMIYVGGASAGALDQLVVSGGLVVAVGDSAADGHVVAVHQLATGATAWYHVDNCGIPVVLVVAQVVITRTCSNNNVSELAARKLATGALVWTRTGNWQLQRGDTDTTAGRHVFAIDPSGTVVSLDPLTGQTQYTLTQATSVLAVDNSQAYAACGTGVCAYDSATGSLRWQVNPGFTPALAAEAGGVLYLDQGTALNTGNGQLLAVLWRGTATWLAIGPSRIAVVTDPRVLDLYGLPGS